MSYSYSSTESTTFTITHAKYIAAKVATDLKRIQRFYHQPSNGDIDDYEHEIVQLLKYGYLEKVTYGFKRGGNWIEPTLLYTAAQLGIAANDDPGKVRPGKDISNSSFYSFLEYSSAWYALTETEKEEFKKPLSLKRGFANTPGISGYLEEDRTYSSGGKSLLRSSVRSYS